MSLIAPEGSVTVHRGQVQVTVGHRLFFVNVVIGGEHLADLHESFVLGLGNDEERVESHSHADPTEDQVTVGTHRDLWWRERERVEFSFKKNHIFRLRPLEKER